VQRALDAYRLLHNPTSCAFAVRHREQLIIDGGLISYGYDVIEQYRRAAR
jgi:hypothetical protein